MNNRRILTKVVSTLLVIALLSCTMCGFALTASADYASDISVSDSVTREREYLVVTQTTEYWQYLPYSVIDNTILYYLQPGEQLLLISAHTDYKGGLWYYCKINTGPLDDVRGYISAYDVKVVHEGP